MAAKSTKARPWENSAADKRADAKAAKKKGIPVGKYEGSAADKKADAAAQKKRKKKRAKK